MKGTKIIVIKLRELIKTALFITVGIILLIALIYLFMPKNAAAPTYFPGTHSSQIILNGNPINVDVTVSETEILNIGVRNLSETQEVFFPLLQATAETISAEIIRTQTLDVETPPEAQETSRVFLQAVEKALNEAEIQH